MSKVKKVLAIILSMAMILGMSLTTFAAPSTSASINISGLVENDNTLIRVYPVVVWDSDANDWDVSDWVTEGNIDIETGTANWDGLKTDATKEGTTPDPVYDETVNTSSVEITGLDIGMYLILAEGDDTTYEVMGVQTYTYENDNLIGPLEADVYAKGEGYPVDKTFTVEDAKTIVGYGDEISYDITATFPSFADNSVDKTFWIEDQPDGLSIQNIVVKVNDVVLTEGDDYTLSQAVPAAKDQAVRVTFTEAFIGETNEHATQSVLITVKAKVETTGTYSNTADSNKGSDEKPTVDRDTGSMTLTKKDETLENVLAGAVFEIWKDGKAVSFVSTGNSDEYRVALDTEEGNTQLTVGDDGTTKGQLILLGLSEGTYIIKEIKAPDGYAKIQYFNKVIAFSDSTDPAEDNTIHLEFDVQNSKLSSLPETGGMGTTIFTIGGCVIMIAAAGLYFASRRKESK